jgi:CHC2 zinc finger
MTSRFDPRLLPPARVFYEDELGRLTRPSRGWARGNCPFHESKSHTSFSVQLDSGGFYCHGCQVKGGNIVDFVRLRYKLSFPDACKQLGCRQDVDADERRRLDQHVANLRREQERAEQAKLEQRAKIIATRDEIHCTVDIYQEISDRLGELHRGARETYEGEQEHCWEVLALALDDLRISEDEYCNLCGLENPWQLAVCG